MKGLDACAAGGRTVPRYLFAATCACAALGPWVIAGRAGTAASLLLLVAAVVVASHACGSGPGFAAAILATLVSVALLFPLARADIELRSSRGMELLAAVAVSVFVSWLLRDERGARRRQANVISALARDPETGIYAVDRRGRVLYVNDTASAMLGWTDAELRGRAIHDLIHHCTESTPSDERCPLRVPPVPSTVRALEDVVLARRGGEAFPAACLISPIVGGRRVTGVVVSFRDVAARKEAEEAFHRTEERYRTLVETSPDSIVMTDMFGYVVMANRRAAELYGYGDPEDLVGAGSLELIAPQDRRRAARDKRKTLKEGSTHTIEYSALRRDGKTFPVELSSSLVVDDDGKPTGFIIVGRDVTERRRAEATLRASETRAATQHAASLVLAESATLGEVASKLLETVCKSDGWHLGVFWLVDQNTQHLRCRALWQAVDSRASSFAHLTRELTFPRGTDLPGRAWETGKPIWVNDVVSEPQFSRALMASQGTLHAAVCVPVRIGSSVQGIMEFFSRDSRPYDDDLVRMLQTLSTQVGQFIERKHAEQALEYQAMHDALTELPNRTLLYRRLQRALRSAGVADGHLALLLLDLDRFKEVNDTLGHHCGDLLLREVSTRLRYALRESDTVARLGGDEFAVLLPSTDETGAITVAGAVLTTLAQPVQIEMHSLDIGTSIGIAVYPEHGVDADILIQRADIAMYAAKRAKSGHMVYSPEFDQHSPDRLARTLELRQAIERGALLLEYQPKVDMRSGETNAVEALVRWRRAEQHIVPPDEFIPLAEQTGLITPLTLWVLNSALRQCRAWHEQGWNLRVAVNLSAQNLHDVRLVDTVGRLLRQWRVRPDWLELEITESAIMVDSTRALAALTALHDTGVHISIDDFGTGYSSLAYLKRLPVDEIKIDKSFVLEMASNDSDAFIARTIIDLGHNMGLRVVAEGVESRAIWERLFSIGCDLAQGYYLGLPQPAQAISEQLSAPAVSTDHEGVAEPETA